MSLPSADVTNPHCGACGDETSFDGDWFTCEGCLLAWDPSRLDAPAEYLDETRDPCHEPCSNYWHGDHAIAHGKGFNCQPCALPAGHESDHWTDCRPVDVEAASDD